MKRILAAGLLLLESCQTDQTSSVRGSSDPSWHLQIERDLGLAERADILPEERLFAGKSPAAREDAFFLLLNATDFSPYPQGESGDHIALSSSAFDTIRRQPDAAAVFGDLVRRGSDAGKLFGLCGLYLVDRSAFETSVKPFLANERKVPLHIGGCDVEAVRTCDVVAAPAERNHLGDIRSGKYPRSLAQVQQWPSMYGSK